MIVYHGSNSVVVHPDIKFSRNSTDFSKGFYVTNFKEQSFFWARRILQDNKTAFVNQYNLNEKELNKLKVLRFNTYSLEWLKFVCNCRLEMDKTDYDVVIGPIADDKVYDTLNLFFSGLIDEITAINKIKYLKPNMQICIRNNEAINKILTFESCEAIYGK